MLNLSAQAILFCLLAQLNPSHASILFALMWLVFEYNNWLLDDEVISRQIMWHSHNLPKDYDTFLFEEVKGLFSWEKLCYVVFLDATTATLEVTLINGEEENSTKLYGKLTARNGDFLDESAAKSELFCKTLAENIVVSRGQLIPLSRSLVAVSLDSYLIVEAELWDSFNGNEIAKGIAEIPAQPYGTGTSEKTICGEYGEIKVKVTWDLLDGEPQACPGEFLKTLVVTICCIVVVCFAS
ncbi:hypothetical protein L1049_020794 [Liquidambar formosana]|uniref:DUF6598 domain-containing protein n=1 Tax=Liquidambar formosana TaxID=63359 RepID=A0AAP0SBW7_LIQFO